MDHLCCPLLLNFCFLLPLSKLCNEASGKIAYKEKWVKCLCCVVNKCFFLQLWASDNTADEGEGGEGGEGGQEAK